MGREIVGGEGRLVGYIDIADGELFDEIYEIDGSLHTVQNCGNGILEAAGIAVDEPSDESDT